MAMFKHVQTINKPFCGSFPLPFGEFEIVWEILTSNQRCSAFCLRIRGYVSRIDWLLSASKWKDCLCQHIWAMIRNQMKEAWSDHIGLFSYTMPNHSLNTQHIAKNTVIYCLNTQHEQWFTSSSCSRLEKGANPETPGLHSFQGVSVQLCTSQQWFHGNSLRCFNSYLSSTELCPKGWNAYAAAYAPAVLAYAQE